MVAPPQTEVYVINPNDPYQGQQMQPYPYTYNAAPNQPYPNNPAPQPNYYQNDPYAHLKGNI